MIELNGKKYTKLNLACSDTPHLKFPEPWLNTDIKSEIADYICDVRELPNDWTEKFDEARASHVLEHLYMNEWIPTLNEWVRVLKPGGILRIAVPDLDIVLRCLKDGHDKKTRTAISGIEPTPVMAQIFGIGYETPETDARWRHRMIFDAKSLIELLEKQGDLEDIKVYPQEEDPAAELDIRDDSQNQFTMCVMATKK
jgi:SAM-dependent methyltransferase